MTADEVRWLEMRFALLGSDWEIVQRGIAAGLYWIKVRDRWTGRIICLDSPCFWDAHRLDLARAWNRWVPADLPRVEVA